MAKKPELKKCPFCGGEARMEPSLYESSRVDVSCVKCEAMISRDTEKEAAGAWNARAKLED